MATVVVKLGGAAITDKSSPDRFSEQLDNLVDGVATAYQNYFLPNGKRLILIHGAGSFGHPPAKKYSVKSGWQGLTEEGDGGDESSQERLEDEHRRIKFGMALTRQRVLQLHQHILQKLQDRGRLPVLSISTYDTVETDGGVLTAESCNRLLDRVQNLLMQGFIPLLFGDAVFDRTRGCTILSGDALMHQLASRLTTVCRCIFVTDVAGIYTKDPKHFPDAVLIKRLHCSDTDHGALDESHAASVDDVTGAMRSKWQWAVRIMTDAPQLRQVTICQTSDSERALAMNEHGHENGNAGDDEGYGSSGWTTIVR